MSFSDWLDKKAILVTGKGGVGKTLVASLIAREAVKRGKRVCLMQCSIEDQIGPLFGSKEIVHAVTPLMPGLDAINLDLDLNFRDFIVHQMGFERVFEQIFNQKLVKSFLGVIPGLRELALIGRVYHYAMLEKPAYDLVIFDGFSSGHFLQLMTTPTAIFDSGIVGTVLNVTKRVDEFFRDQSACGTVVVTHPEFLPLTECVDLLRELGERSPSAVCGVVVNRFPIAVTTGSERDKLSASRVYASQRFSRAKEQMHAAAGSIFDLLKSSRSSTPHLTFVDDCGVVREPLDTKTLAGLNIRDLTSAGV